MAKKKRKARAEPRMTAGCSRNKDCACTTLLMQYDYWRGNKDEESIPIAEARRRGCAWVRKMIRRRKRR